MNTEIRWARPDDAALLLNPDFEAETGCPGMARLPRDL